MQEHKPSRAHLALTGNIRILALESFLSQISAKMLGVVWQPFVLSLGASMAVLGGLESIRSLTSALIQPILGWAADKVGRKPFIVLGSFLTVIAFSLCVIASTWHFLIPAILLLGASALSGPARQSLLAESVAPGERATAYSVVSFPAALTGFFAPLAGGFLATHYGFKSVFYVSIVTVAVSSVLIVLFLRETFDKGNFGIAGEDVKGALKGVLKPESGLERFYAAMALNAFSVGMLVSILYGMLTKTFGFTPYQLGVMGTLFWMAIAVSQIPAGKLADRYGRKTILVVSGVLFIVLCFGWLLSRSFEAFALLHILAGVSVAPWGPAASALLADSVPLENRAEAMGKFACFTGLIASPAPYVGGILYELFGFYGPVVATLLLKVLTLLIIIQLNLPQVSEPAGG